MINMWHKCSLTYLSCLVDTDFRWWFNENLDFPIQTIQFIQRQTKMAGGGILRKTIGFGTCTILGKIGTVPLERYLQLYKEVLEYL